MLDGLVEAGVPAATFFLMTLVGLELETADFRRAAHHPGAIAAATLGQLLLLPLLVSGMILALAPPAAVTAGMILIAACPPAILSSVYVSLAEGDTALAVTLNAVFDLLSIVTLPLVLGAGLALHLQEASRIRPPVLMMMGQLLFLVLVPIGVGMLLRRGFPVAVEARRAALQRASLLVIIALMGSFLLTQARAQAAPLGPTSVAAGCFTGLAMASGWVLGRGFGLPQTARLAVAFVFASRSVAVAAVVAVTLLHRPDFLFFGTIFFLVHTALMLLAVGGLRLSSRTSRVLLPHRRASRRSPS